jgi:hypothetical protein
VADDASVWVKIPHVPITSWNMDVTLDFLPTNAANIRICVHTVGRDTFYIQAGNNDRQVSFYEKKENVAAAKLRIAGRKGLMNETNKHVSIRLTLSDDRTWTLYTARHDEDEYYMEGSYQMPASTADTHSALMKVAFRTVKGKKSSFHVCNIIVEGFLPDNPEPEVTEEPDSPPAPETPDTPPAPTPSYEPASVTISEVMANPKGLTAFPQTEYVELRNNTGEEINLRNWAFVYDGKDVLIDTDVKVPPSGYAVLHKAGREIYSAPPSPAVGLSKFPSTLANSGKTVGMKDPSGGIIDMFDYPAARAGVSWERSADGQCRLCTDPRGGTPGEDNSEEAEVAPAPPSPPAPPEKTATELNAGDIVFNEILPDPQKGGSEYIELYNRTKSPVSLSRLSIAVRKNDGSAANYPLSSISKVIAGGGYALLTSGKEGVASFYMLADPDAVHEVKLPTLNNSSSGLMLLDMENGLNVIDAVRYYSQWHSPLIHDRKGVALERIDPDAPSQEEGNWTSASSFSGYGTPGYQNSQYMRKPDLSGTPSGISSPVLSEDGRYRIDYYLDAPGYACRAYIYNLAGYRVAEISNNELAGTSGSLYWDGAGGNGQRLAPGIYIFHAEAYNVKGNTVRYKKAFLVK